MRIFQRTIDNGHGYQLLIIDSHKKVIYQGIYAHQGMYTGDGNPEFVGKKTSEIKHFWKTFHEMKGDAAIDTAINILEEIEEAKKYSI